MLIRLATPYRAIAVLLCLAAAAPMTPLPPIPAEASAPPDVVQRFVDHMRDNITLGRLADGTPMQAETPAERARPILPRALTQQVFDRGVLSGLIEGCGGDWQVMSYQPLLAALRANAGLTPKQIGFVTLLHDAAREQGNNIPEEQCTAAKRKSLAALARKVRTVPLAVR